MDHRFHCQCIQRCIYLYASGQRRLCGDFLRWLPIGRDNASRVAPQDHLLLACVLPSFIPHLPYSTPGEDVKIDPFLTYLGCFFHLFSPGISNRGMKKISQRKRRRIKRRNQEQEAHDKEKATQGKERRLSEALAQASNYLAEIDLPKTVDPDVVFVKRYFVAKGTRPEKTVETVEIDSDSDDDCYIDQDSTDDERPFSDDYSDDPDYCCVEGQIPVQPSVRPRRNR